MSAHLQCNPYSLPTGYMHWHGTLCCARSRASVARHSLRGLVRARACMGVHGIWNTCLQVVSFIFRDNSARALLLVYICRDLQLIISSGTGRLTGRATAMPGQLAGRRARTWAAHAAAPLKPQAALLFAIVRHAGRKQEQVRAADARIYAGRRGLLDAATWKAYRKLASTVRWHKLKF